MSGMRTGMCASMEFCKCWNSGGCTELGNLYIFTVVVMSDDSNWDVIRVHFGFHFIIIWSYMAEVESEILKCEGYVKCRYQRHSVWIFNLPPGIMLPHKLTPTFTNFSRSPYILYPSKVSVGDKGKKEWEKEILIKRTKCPHPVVLLPVFYQNTGDNPRCNNSASTHREPTLFHYAYANYYILGIPAAGYHGRSSPSGILLQASETLRVKVTC